MPLDVTAGWTGPIDFQLKADGVPAPFGVGATVELILRRADDVLITTAGNVSILSAPDGTVRYYPDANDLVDKYSPYRARYKVTDAGLKVVFFPSGAPDVWTVWKA